MPTSSERQLEHSAAALTVALHGLERAKDPADVREAAADAAPAAGDAAGFLAANNDQPVELVAVAEALTAIATLTDASGETPGVWQAAAPSIGSLADIEHPLIDPALVADAVDNADDVISASAAAFTAWAADNEAAIAGRDAAIAGATDYQSAMQREIDRYIGLRNRLSDYIELVDTQGSTMSEAYFRFADAAQERREVRGAMLALDPPADLDDEHSQVAAVISDGIDAIESAQRSLDAAVCVWSVCYVEDEPSYQNFRLESKRITDALDAAIRNWESAAAQAVADARALPLPEKPEV